MNLYSKLYVFHDKNIREESVKRVINFVIQFLSDLMFCDEHNF